MPPIDDRTTNLNLAKVNAANSLAEDVVRLRDFADNVDTALNLRALSSAVPPNSRTISAGTGLTGGGDLTTNRTISLSAGSIASLALADTSVQPARTISTGSGLTGGGDLSTNRTISLSAGSIASLALADSSVQPARSISTGSGLNGGGDLNADRTISLVWATNGEALAGSSAVVVMNPVRTSEAIQSKATGIALAMSIIFG
jgi:hypothetical protein